MTAAMVHRLVKLRHWRVTKFDIHEVDYTDIEKKIFDYSLHPSVLQLIRPSHCCIAYTFCHGLRIGLRDVYDEIGENKKCKSFILICHMSI